MKAGIISAGFNLRLKSAGKPKGLIEINGKTIIKNKIDCLKSSGFKEIHFIIRENSHELQQYLNNIKNNYSIEINIIKYNSVSPLDSTFIFRNIIEPNEGILVFNVDAIFDYKDLERFTLNMKESLKQKDKDMIMWASPILKNVNEDPAYIRFNESLEVLEYGKNIEPTNFVFGQIRYCSHRILNLQNKLKSEENTKMNLFIKYLIKNNYNVSVFKTTNHTFDIDTPNDLKNFNKFSRHGKF